MKATKTITQSDREQLVQFIAALEDTHLVEFIHKCKVEITPEYVVIVPPDVKTENRIFKDAESLLITAKRVLKRGLDVKSFSGLDCRIRYTDCSWLI